METVRRIQRKLGRAVTWEPTHDVFFRFADMLHTSQGVPPLYVAQSVLLEVDARLREGDVPVPFGLLVGDWCVCPRTAREYLLVAEIMPGHIEPFGEAMTAALVHELRTLARIAEQRGRRAIGWYLGGADVLGPLGREDVALHRSAFPEPWQVMLVRDGVEGVQHGAFIRIELSEQRPFAIRFFEDLPDSILPHEHTIRTAVRWVNYETSEPVIRIDDAKAIGVAPAPGQSFLRKLVGLRNRLAIPRIAPPQANGKLRHEPTADRTTTQSEPLSPSPATPREIPPALSAPTAHATRPEPLLSAPDTSLRAPRQSAAARIEERIDPPRRTGAPALPDQSSEPPAGIVSQLTPAISESPAKPLTPTADPRVSRATTESAGGNAARPRAKDQPTAPASRASTGPRRSAQDRSTTVTTEPAAPVPAKNTQPADIRLRMDRMELNQGESLQLLTSVLDAAGNLMPDFPIAFASSDERILKISSTGLATSIGPAGTITVEIRAGHVRQTARISVLPVGTSVQVQPSIFRLPQHGTQQLEATLFDRTGAPVNAAKLAYTSSNPSVVSVSADGRVTSLGPAGAASITVHAGAASASVQLTVTQVATSIEVLPRATELMTGRRRRLTARVLDGVGVAMRGQRVLFSSSDPTLLTVSSDGVVSSATGSREGEAIVEARLPETGLRTLVPVRIIGGQRRTGKIDADIAIPGAYCVVITSANEAYVAPLGAPIVRVDLATNQVSAIPGSEGGLGIAFDEARGEVYAAAYITNTIDIISVEKRSVVATIDVPDQVLHIVVSSNTDRAYLGLNRGIAVLDLQSREVKLLDLPVFGLHLALHPSRPLLYVSGNASSVTEIDLESGGMRRTFALTAPASGQALAVTPDGASLFIANEQANSIDQIELSAGRLVSSFPLPSQGVWGMALSPNGKRIFASSPGVGGLVSMDSASGRLLKTFPGTGGYRLAVSADGAALLVAGAGSGLLILR